MNYEFNSQVAFIHLIILTQREDLIFYSLKKWQIKDNNKYNIFTLKEIGGYDVFSLMIMTNNEEIIHHVLSSYFN